MLRGCFFLAMRIVFLVIPLVVFLGATVFATSCDTQGGSNNIGREFLSYGCVPANMNDSQALNYTYRPLLCDDDPASSTYHQVIYNNAGLSDDVSDTPANVANNYATFYSRYGYSPYRVFRNSEGSQVIAVHAEYSGTVDGVQLNSYPANAISTDIVHTAFLLPGAAPDCSGGDFTPCPSGTC